MSKTNMDTIKDEVALRVFAELLARNTYSADWFKSWITRQPVPTMQPKRS